MRNIIKNKPGEMSFITWIKKRIKSNLNLVSVATGPTGIGKSWAMIKIGHELDNEFENRQIAFSFRQVIDILNSEWFPQKKIKTIVFDEVQISLSNRQWQSLTNRLINYLLSTFRHRNVVLLMTSPYVDFLDSQSRKLIHVEFEVKGHNQKTRLTHLRPKLLQYNSSMKKFYTHSLYVIKDGDVNKLVNWWVEQPPKHLIEPYEKAKLEFTDKLNKGMDIALKKLEKEDEEIDTRKRLTERQSQILKLYEELGNQQKVADKIGINQSLVASQLKLARNKGYFPEKQPNYSKL